MSEINIDLLRKDECQPLTNEQMNNIKSQFHPSNTANVNIVPYHAYSTDEQEVGKTTDGTTIYEKTITGLNIRLNWLQQYCTDSSEIDPLIQNVGIVYSCNARCNGTTDADLNTTTNLPIVLKRKNSNGKWIFRSYDDYIVKEVTIQYTKTTS